MMTLVCLGVSPRYHSQIQRMAAVDGGDVIFISAEEMGEVDPILARLKEQGRTIGGVFTLKDFWLPLAAEIQEKWGSFAPSVPSALAWAVKDKWGLRDRLQSTELNPIFHRLSLSEPKKLEGLKQNSSENHWVLKPRFGYGSGGVRFYECFEAVAEAFGDKDLERATCEVNRSVSVAGNGSDVLLEEYIDGPEYAADGLVVDGKVHVLAVCAKTPMVRPYFEEISYQTEFNGIEKVREKLTSASQSFANALELKNSAFHLEFRIREDRVFLIDAGLRIGGGGLAHDLVEISTGFSFLQAAIKICQGKKPSIPEVFSSERIAVLFLHQLGEGGVLSEVPEAPSPFQAPSPFEECGVRLERYEMACKPGDRLRPYPYYSGHPGFALFSMNSQRASAHSHSASPEGLIQWCRDHLRLRYQA